MLEQTGSPCSQRLLRSRVTPASQRNVPGGWSGRAGQQWMGVAGERLQRQQTGGNRLLPTIDSCGQQRRSARQHTHSRAPPGCVDETSKVGHHGSTPVAHLNASCGGVPGTAAFRHKRANASHKSSLQNSNLEGQRNVGAYLWIGPGDDCVICKCQIGRKTIKHMGGWLD